MMCWILKHQTSGLLQLEALVGIQTDWLWYDDLGNPILGPPWGNAGSVTECCNAAAQIATGQVGASQPSQVSTVPNLSHKFLNG